MKNIIMMLICAIGLSGCVAEVSYPSSQEYQCMVITDDTGDHEVCSYYRYVGSELYYWNAGLGTWVGRYGYWHGGYFYHGGGYHTFRYSGHSFHGGGHRR
jgi:hypothetical protein